MTPGSQELRQGRPDNAAEGAGRSCGERAREKAFVSVIIPCRNEGKCIGRCLDSLIANDYAKDQLELLVVDGMSEDGTRIVVEDYVRKYPFIRLLDNPKKITSAALNTGIRNAQGEIIMRADAHNIYPPDYISGLVGWLVKIAVDNVGGTWVTLPGNHTVMAQAIAVALSHPFGVGNAYFRIGISEPRLVDTVPFGCYRREVFNRVGMFDEELVRDQDEELNYRLIKQGGRILLVPRIFSYYYARESLVKLWRAYYQYGYFKPLVARKLRRIMTRRQLVPPLLVVSILGLTTLAPWLWGARLVLGCVAAGYAAANITCSIAAGFRKALKCTLALLIVFPVLHFSYGLGFAKGVLDFLILRRKSGWNVAGAPISR